MFRVGASFSGFGASAKLIEKLNLVGIKEPSAVQRALIPAYSSHSDIILKNTTGSGKTMGICIAIVNKPIPSLKLNNLKGNYTESELEFSERRLANKKFISTIVLVPTRFFECNIGNLDYKYRIGYRN